MGRLAISAVLAITSVLIGCPDKDEVVDEIGGAPKRQIDHVQQNLDQATQKVEDRMKRAADAAEE